MSQSYLFSFIAVAALATFLTRLLPFVLLGEYSRHPLVQHFGRYLPAAIMALLVAVFLLRSAEWTPPVWGLEALIPALLVVWVHWRWRNALLSMLLGTASYMLGQQWLLNSVTWL